jgi:hypothetical protein
MGFGKQSILRIFVFCLQIGLLISCSNKSNWNYFGVKGNVKSYIDGYYSVAKELDQWEIGEVE